MRTRDVNRLRLMLCGALAAGAAAIVAAAALIPRPPIDESLEGLAAEAGRFGAPEAVVEALLVLLFAPFERLLRAGTSLGVSAMDSAGYGDAIDAALTATPCASILGMTLSVLAAGVVSVVAFTRPQEELL